MDDIALNYSNLTTPDRADRARKAWEIYKTVHGGEIQDLVSDLLHLADVDEVPGGGAYTAERAVRYYTAELPEWPTEGPKFAGTYVAQTRSADGPWLTVGSGDGLSETAETLISGMQQVGFYTSDMAGHVGDLVKGHILTSEAGHEFRVTRNPDAS